MLTALQITNFTLVESLEIDFSSGLTAITGETGTGKSLILDALAMALGDRADTGRIRQGKEKLDVTAFFDLTQNQQAQQWLTQNDFDDSSDSIHECLLRRSLNQEGRSRGHINGQPATMLQLRTLGEMLIDIHTQHEHQSLLRTETHRNLVDSYASASKLTAEVKERYQQWRKIQQQLTHTEQQADAVSERRDLLQFQIDELSQLASALGDVAKIEQEHQMLSNAENMQRDCYQIIDQLKMGEQANIAQQLNHCLQLAENLAELSPKLEEARQLIQSAAIEVEEASSTIQQHLDNFEANPERLQELDELLSNLLQLARKHHVEPEQLTEKLESLENELTELDETNTDPELLKEQLQLLSESYLAASAQLTEVRQAAATKLAEGINYQLTELEMKGVELQVSLSKAEQFSAHGMESIELKIRTNPGQPHGSLRKVASGGELSRISLAIQVVAAEMCQIPTLVFDEVDVGIGGATGKVVGKLLRELGEKSQVICITHLAQVASQAHHHLIAQKQLSDHSAESRLIKLSDNARIDEIARMMGGDEGSDSAIAHAREMLEEA